MFLRSIALCYLMLKVQSQDPFFSQPYNPDFLYFPDHIGQALPLSVPGSNAIDKDVVRRIFNDEPQQKKKPTTTVEIEKSAELAFGSSIEPETEVNKQNIISRQLSTPMIPSRETAQQLALERQTATHIAQNRESALQVSQDRARLPQRGPNRSSVPEISLSRPSVAVPQSELDRPTLQQITLGRPIYQTSQERPSGPEVSFSRPTVTVPQTAPSQISNFNSPLKSQDFTRLLYSVTNFGVNLLKNIDDVHSGNVVVSPYSITSLLALVQQGSWGQTLKQISDALNMTPVASASAYAKYGGDIQNRNSRNILKVANGLFVAEAFAINQEFQRRAISSFNSDITPLSFDRPDQAARHINSWVASKTANNIEKLIAPDSLSASTQLVLVNAVYFKGLWEVPFRVEFTRPGEFQLSNGQTKTAQYMRTRKLFKTGTDPTTNAKVIVLPFERDEYHLMVILPSQLMGIKSTLSSLTDARLLSYLSFEALYTDLELPKFTIRSDTDLKAIFNKMGISNMFSRFAELNGIGSYRTYPPQISSAVHSAVLSIDEHGGSAAAATAFAAVALSYDDPAIEFKVNRPFIAVLWDNQSSLPLFMAKIEDPYQ